MKARPKLYTHYWQASPLKDQLRDGFNYGTKLEVVPSVKLLGLEIVSELSFNSYVEKLYTKLSQRIGILKKDTIFPAHETKII